MHSWKTVFNIYDNMKISKLEYLKDHVTEDWSNDAEHSILHHFQIF